MDFELALSPTGRFSVRECAKHSESGATTDDKAKPTKIPTRISRLRKSFEDSNSAGLFELAAGQVDSSLPPAFQYWKAFAGRFLDNVCQMPEGVDVSSIPPLGDAEISSLILNVPPMTGAEYVSREMLAELWNDLDIWFRKVLQTSKQSLASFLQQRAPLWHQVGRVCFHLAENRRDPDYPFAFLATYAPSAIGNGKKIQYQPLCKALKQNAGAENKHALIKLLSPIQLASESSELVRELVNSGDLYEPLAWTPPEAYQFLKDVPAMEQSGITVRLPDWWKKRSRPRVGITIGNATQPRFDADGMLDFRMHVALGDEELTPEEFEALLDDQDGLVLLKGQWVEVDREKLEQALQHWQAVEEHATGGLSFSDGMRLLAGAPADLSDDVQGIEVQDWSFVDAGDWLGRLLSDLRSPESLDAMRPGKAAQGHSAAVPSDGRELVGVLDEFGAGRLLGRRHGAGEDDSGDFAAPHSQKEKGWEAVLACAARITHRQLAIGNRTVCALTFDPVCPLVADIERRTHQHGAQSNM